MTVVDEIAFAEAKTKHATDLLKAFGLQDQRRVLVILTKHDPITYKCFRNLPDVEVRTAPATGGESAETTKSSAFSTRDLLVAHKLVIAKEALAKIELGRSSPEWRTVRDIAGALGVGLVELAQMIEHAEAGD